MSELAKYEFILLSESNVKKEAVEKIIECFFEENAVLKTVGIPDSSDRPEQPIGKIGTISALNKRVEAFFEMKLYDKICDKSKITFVISVENGIYRNEATNLWYDICYVYLNVIRLGVSKGGEVFLSPTKIFINKKQMEGYQLFLKKLNEGKEIATEMTFGEYITKFYKGETNIPKNNWMKHLVGVDRVTQIFDGLVEAFNFMVLLDKN
jgi:non-canonical (house-cleaning) NTP pyrophosphatase